MTPNAVEGVFLNGVQIFAFGRSIMHFTGNLPRFGGKFFIFQVGRVVAGKSNAANGQFFEFGKVLVVVVLDFLGRDFFRLFPASGRCTCRPLRAFVRCA